MATTQQAGEQSFHDVSMAHDDFGNLRAYTLKIFTELRYLLLNVSHFIIPSDIKYCLICSRYPRGICSCVRTSSAAC